MCFVTITRSLLLIGFSILWSPAFAATSFNNTPKWLEGHKGSIGGQFYTTVGWHDGGRKLGFFLPGLWKNSDSQVWWDTGIVWKGSGVGYRTMLDVNHFYGVYAYYDVMNFNKQFVPLRLNIGGELSGPNWGSLTVNGYGILLDSAFLKPADDGGGVSAKYSFDTWFTRFKPFVAGSYSWVKFKNETEYKVVPSVAFGTKWLISNAFDIEVKWIRDQHQFFLHGGFQIRSDDSNPKSNYFKHRFNRPPDRYIPHYANVTKAIVSAVENSLDQHMESTSLLGEERLLFLAMSKKLNQIKHYLPE